MNYPFRKYVRLSGKSNQLLAKRVKKEGKRENVILREIIEKGLEKQEAQTS